MEIRHTRGNACRRRARMPARQRNVRDARSNAHSQKHGAAHVVGSLDSPCAWGEARAWREPTVSLP
eukprot:scaffold159755_cov32-Tisochrysis_lutea.AAC.4